MGSRDVILQRPQRSLMQRWQIALGKYSVVLRVSVASNLAYSTEIFFRTLLMLIMVFILSQLWRTTFALRSTQLLSGFSITNMIWYLCAAESIAMSLPQLSKRIDLEVRSGQLAYLLGRPCSYVFYNFAHYLGERLVRFCINSMVGIALALIVAGVPQISWQGVLAWPLVVFLAMSIDFVAYFAIGLLAFWTEETQSFSLIFSRLTLVMGGVIAPLEIFPQPLRSIAQALPFSAILYGPARTLIHFDLSNFSMLILQQGLTLLIGSGIVLVIYQIALRRVNINGG